MKLFFLFEITLIILLNTTPKTSIPSVHLCLLAQVEIQHILLIILTLSRYWNFRRTKYMRRKKCVLKVNSYIARSEQQLVQVILILLIVLI